nr:hypothetical protein [Tanacetum cinerariifolium]
MVLTFTDTHNMIAYLTKSDVSEGFDQIIDFLNASLIKYALTVNPNIYVSCIKQFWTSISMKKVNDVTRLQALVFNKKVIIIETIIRDALRLDDAESIDCLPNEEIFTELSRMGAAEVNVDDVPAAGVADECDADVNADVVLTAIEEPYIPSPTPPTQPLPPSQDLPSISQQGRIIASMDADVDVTLKDVAEIAKEVALDAEIEKSADV